MIILLFGITTLFASAGELKWRYQTGGYVFSSPGIRSDGTVCVGSYDGNLYAINPDGTLKWRFKTDGGIESSPAIGSNGTVYVGSSDGNLYAIYPYGTLKWRYQTSGSVYSSPAIGADGTVYVGSSDGNLYAINPDGTLKWRYPLGDVVRSSPAIGTDGTVYVGSFDRNLYAIDSGIGQGLADSPWPMFGRTPDHQRRAELKPTAVVEENESEKTIPVKYALSQNYPNPFNSETVLRYDLPEKASVRLSVYNLRGQIVRVLAEGERKAGSYAVSWDGRDSSGRILGSGIYFYRIETSDFAQTRRMVLLK